MKTGSGAHPRADRGGRDVSELTPMHHLLAAASGWLLLPMLLVTWISGRPEPLIGWAVASAWTISFTWTLERFSS